MAPQPPPDRVTPLGPWELRNAILTPTRCSLQSHAARIQSQQSTDPLITISLQPPSGEPATATIHRSLLSSASPALRALASSSDPVVEWADTFGTIRKFLYLEPIDIAAAPPDLALAAARWGLHVLHEAVFALAERHHAASLAAVARWMPVMAAIPVPNTFKTVFALRFVSALDDADSMWLSSGGAWGDWRAVPDEAGTVPETACVCDAMEDGERAKPRALAGFPAGTPAVDEADIIRCATALRVRGPKTKRCGRTPERGPCGDCSTVWTVFQKQGMLREVAAYLMRFGRRDHGALVLDVVLRQLETGLSDSEALAALRALGWETGYGDVLAGAGALGWSVRGWQLVTRARDEVRVGWDEVRVGMVMRGLKRALPEPGNRAVMWESERADARVDGVAVGFLLRVECGSRKSKRLPPLVAAVRAVGDVKSVGKKRVRVDAALVEDECGCELRASAAAEAGFGVGVDEEVFVSTFARVGGVGMKLMEGGSLKRWVDLHEPGCALRCVVRLLVQRESAPPRRDDAPGGGRWAQTWQLECACGRCHRDSGSDSGNGAPPVK